MYCTAPLTSFNWCCKVYAIRQALRAYCPQIYNVIIVVPLLLCKVNSKVTVTLRYTEALMLHCFLKKTVHLQGFWPKTVYLKCFGNQLKTVYLQGPHSLRPCISRPCCNIKSRKKSGVFSFAKAFWYENEQTKSKIRGIRRDNTILDN